MQLCWAHLKRDILGIAEDARSRSAQQFGRDALAVVARLFRLWYRFRGDLRDRRDRKSTRLNSSHVAISYAVFCLKKKKKIKAQNYQKKKKKKQKKKLNMRNKK